MSVSPKPTTRNLVPLSDSFAAQFGSGMMRALVRLSAAAFKRLMLTSISGLALSGVGELFGRYAIHATVLGLTLLVIAVSGVPQVESLANSPLTTTSVVPLAPAKLEPFVTQGFFANNGNSVSRLADLHTSIPFRTRREVVFYSVQPGDTVQGIALTYGLYPETIMWSNPAIEDLPDLLRIGQEVVILPIDGVYHEVQEGDTLESIASKYKTDVNAIIGAANEWNGLEEPRYAISPGMMLIVAGGAKPYVPKLVTAYSGSIPTGARGTGRFQWPVLGRITQDYWYGHRALDIAAPSGTPVYAADGGFVTFAAWTDVGYGYLIRVDHGNGYATWYAHLSNFNVVLGETVQRGDLIGYVGSTGHSSGPHLHFEIRTATELINPRFYLP